MKRTTGILLLLMLVLAGGAYYFLNQEDMGNDSSEFAYKNTDKIYQILLSHPNGKKINLERGAEGWLINNKPVRQEPIDLLMNTLQRLHVRSKVPNAAKKNVQDHLKRSGITAKALDKSGNLLKTWIVGTESPGKMGTYMMLGGSNQPYDVDIMGWNGTLRARFMLDEEAWRDRAVFKTKTKDIQSVSVEYFGEKNKNSSFTIKLNEEKEYEVNPLLSSTKNSDKAVVKQKVLHYLKGYESKIAENFVNDFSARDSIVQTTPFCQIKLEDKTGKIKDVKLFVIPVTGATADEQVLRNDVERYHASVNDNEDFMLVQHRVFYALFPPYTYFFEE